MARKKLPKGVRKHIRREKARIRREFFDVEKQNQEINKLYQEFLRDKSNKKYED